MVEQNNQTKSNIKKKISIITIILCVIGIIIFISLFCLTKCKKNTTNPELYKAIPTTEKYYEINDEDEIVGWSSEVLDNFNRGDCKMLEDFNMMDLSGWKIASNCLFGDDKSGSQKDEANMRVFNNANWTLKKIDLSNTKWLPILDRGITGFFSFSSIKFDDLIELDLSNANFAYYDNLTLECSNCYTADYTFAYCEFCKLENINFTNTIFSCKGVENISTFLAANSTFGDCSFDKLKELDISTTLFASENGGKYSVFISASQTFMNVIFSNLDKLLLPKNGLVCAEMGRTQSYSAFLTFEHAEFSKLEILDLSNIEFYLDNMTTEDIGAFYSGISSFTSAKFESLKEINLSNIVLNDGTGLNIKNNCICDDFFSRIQGNIEWASTKLKIIETDDYWTTQQTDRLNTWFGADNWE